MTPERWQELSESLADAVESGNAVIDDPDLARVFDWHHQAGTFLERPARDLMLDREIAGRYRLIEILGRGGAGVVYRASDSRVADRQVVVKLLHDFWSGEDWMRRRFVEEARVLATLDHPGIVSLLDAGEDGGRLYLVMPYHPGRTLREAMRVDSSVAARWIKALSAAIGYAHERGVLHRDLKPENVLLVRRGGGNEEPLLLDFGIAHDGDPTAATRTTTHLMGSALYMAPEHLMGKPTAASDVYSLAVMAWEVMTGEHPFSAASPFALPELQRQGVGDAFYRLRPDLGLRVGKLLARGLEFDAKRRPRVGEFGEELSEAVAAQGLDSRLARLWALTSSRRWMLAGGVAALAGAAGGGWVLRDQLSPLSAEERVIAYHGGMDEVDNGFVQRNDIRGSAIPEIGFNGFRMQRYTTATQGQIHKRLSLRQKRFAFRAGWRLSGRFRPETGGLCTMLLDVGDFAPRFDISLIREDTMIRAQATDTILNGFSGPSIQFVAPNDLLELIDCEILYNAKSRTASIRAGGRDVVARHPGHAEYRSNTGVYFGISVFQGTSSTQCPPRSNQRLVRTRTRRRSADCRNTNPLALQ